STDPNDNMTAWTVQEYASNAMPSTDIWGTWIQSIAAPAPTLNNPNGSGTQGQTGVTLNLTGTGFYDPGPSFTNHLQVQLTDGSAQRSAVRSITVTFSSTVTFTGGNANAAAAFQLQHVQDSTNVANLQAAVSTVSGQTVVTLTFTTTGNAPTEVDPISILGSA